MTSFLNNSTIPLFLKRFLTNLGIQQVPSQIEAIWVAVQLKNSSKGADLVVSVQFEQPSQNIINMRRIGEESSSEERPYLFNLSSLGGKSEFSLIFAAKGAKRVDFQSKVLDFSHFDNLKSTGLGHYYFYFHHPNALLPVIFDPWANIITFLEQNFRNNSVQTHYLIYQMGTQNFESQDTLSLLALSLLQDFMDRLKTDDLKHQLAFIGLLGSFTNATTVRFKVSDKGKIVLYNIQANFQCFLTQVCQLSTDLRFKEIHNFVAEILVKGLSYIIANEFILWNPDIDQFLLSILPIDLKKVMITHIIDVISWSQELQSEDRLRILKEFIISLELDDQNDYLISLLKIKQPYSNFNYYLNLPNLTEKQQEAVFIELNYVFLNEAKEANKCKGLRSFLGNIPNEKMKTDIRNHLYLFSTIQKLVSDQLFKTDEDSISDQIQMLFDDQSLLNHHYRLQKLNNKVKGMFDQAKIKTILLNACKYNALTPRFLEFYEILVENFKKKFFNNPRDLITLYHDSIIYIQNIALRERCIQIALTKQLSFLISQQENPLIILTHFENEIHCSFFIEAICFVLDQDFKKYIKGQELAIFLQQDLIKQQKAKIWIINMALQKPEFTPQYYTDFQQPSPKNQKASYLWQFFALPVEYLPKFRDFKCYTRLMDSAKLLCQYGHAIIDSNISVGTLRSLETNGYLGLTRLIHIATVHCNDFIALESLQEHVYYLGCSTKKISGNIHTLEKYFEEDKNGFSIQISELEEFKKQEDQFLVKDFEIPESLQSYLKMAEKQEAINKSEVYQVLKSECASTKDAQGKFLTLLNEIVQLNQYHVSKLEILLDLKSLKEEIQIFRQLVENEEGIQKLEVILINLKQKELYKRFFESLMKLSTLYKIDRIDDINVFTSYFQDLESDCKAEQIYIYEQKINGFFTGNLKHKTKIIELINSFGTHFQVTEFLEGIQNIAELEHLQQGVNDYDNGGITIRNIIDLVTVWEFQSQIFHLQRLENMIQDIVLKKGPQLDSLKEILSSLNDPKMFFPIKEMFSKVSESETTKSLNMDSILHDSSLEFHELLDSYSITLKVVVASNNGSVQVQSFSIVDLIDLKRRALLTQADLKFQDPQTVQEQLGRIQIFINLSSTIIQCLAQLNLLKESEFPPQPIQLKQVLFCHDGQFEDIIELNSLLFHIVDQWNGGVEDIYQRYYELTFFNGKMLIGMLKYIKNVNKSKDNGFFSQLRLINEERAQMLESVDVGEFNDLTELKACLIKLGDHLSVSFYQEAQFMVDEQNSNISQRATSKDLTYIESSYSLSAIMTITKMNNAPFPSVSQIFFCSELVSQNELVAFVFRSLLAHNRTQQEKSWAAKGSSPYFFQKHKQERCYFLCGVEHLTFILQEKLLSLLNSFESDRKSYNLCIITSDRTAYISDQIRDKSYTQIVSTMKILTSKEQQQIIKELNLQVTVVQSAYTGLGKTTRIIKAASEGKGQQIKCHFIALMGDYKIDDIGAQLDKIDDSPYALVLQIGFAHNINLLNQILSNLCIFKKLSYGSYVYHLNKDTKIFIELENNQKQNLMDEIPFLNFFTQIYIKEFLLEDITFESFSLYAQEEEKVQEIKIKTVCEHLSSLDLKQYEWNSSNKHLTTDECRKMIEKYFVATQQKLNQKPTYVQLTIFINLLYQLLMNLEQSLFSVSCIQVMKESYKKLKAHELDTMRSTIFINFLSMVNEFNTKGLKLKSMQVNQNALGQSVKISWKDQNHFMLVFLADGSFFPVYKQASLVPESFQKFMCIQRHLEVTATKKRGWFEDRNKQLKEDLKNQAYGMENISMYTHDKCIERLKNYYCRQDTDLTKIAFDCNYVLNPDNYLKIILIQMRSSIGMPIIIMGETGCGKTSLIRFLAESMLKQTFMKIDIHAGITFSEIQSFVDEFTSVALSVLEKDGKVWVFFDEFNTNINIEVIGKILCEREFRGQKLPHNIIFLGACNPYKQKSEVHSQQENMAIGLRKKPKEGQNSLNLLYNVFELPDKVTEHVWDFGQIEFEDFKKYIQAMLSKKILNEYLIKTIDAIIDIHKYYHENEDSSSVSLRDIERFSKLFTWFKQSREERQKLQLEEVKQSSSSGTSQTHSIILALCHCYYLRLPKQKRQCIINLIESNFKLKDVQKLLDEEKEDLSQRMDIPPEIARNSTLKENIFAIIPCILNKIPIFICGKPGSSKSLAMNLIVQNFQGVYSKDAYFKKLPKLIMIFYQGSDSSTSESIQKRYDQALKNQKEMEQKKSGEYLSILVIDEIGLAEVSKHNPLKVLHSLLETQNQKIAFIGISNWRLDASKMNRALYLAIGDPEENILIETALSIYLNITKDKKGEYQEKVIKNLALAYSKMKEEMKKKGQDSDFYGLRDFYSLIKGVSHYIRDYDFNDQTELLYSVKKHIQRNFGGKMYGFKILGEIFSLLQDEQQLFMTIPDLSSLDLIAENLENDDQRYLLIFLEDITSEALLENMLNKNLENRRSMLGSNFKQDQDDVSYIEQSLANVVSYLNKGTSLVFSSMDHIYSSLYDLFNQNFTKAGERNYCRISFGSVFNPSILVGKKFKCIVLVTASEAEGFHQDPPFLNRFEKHYISLEDIFSQREQALAGILMNWINSIVDLKNKDFCLNLNTLFPILNFEYRENQINNFMIHLVRRNMQDDSDDQSILLKCKRYLIKTASIDLFLSAEIKNCEDLEFIASEYQLSHFPSIEKLLESKCSQKLLVYTFQTEGVQQLIETQVHRIGLYNTEKDFETTLEAFFQSEDPNYFVLLEKSQEIHFLNQVKYLLEKWMNDRSNDDSKKTICIIINMKRNINSSQQGENMIFEGWDSYFIDELSDSEVPIHRGTLQMTSAELITTEIGVNFDNVIDELLENCLLGFKYNLETDSKEPIPNITRVVMKKLVNDRNLKQIIKEKAFSLIGEEEAQFQDWRRQVQYDKQIWSQSVNLKGAISKALALQLQGVIQKILYVLLTRTSFESYFVWNESQDDQQALNRKKKLDELWLLLFRNMKIQWKPLIAFKDQEVKIISGLQFPFSTQEYLKLEEQKQAQGIEESNVEELKTFQTQFQKKSLVAKADYLAKINDDQEMQRIYFSDHIKIMLSTNQEGLDYSKILLLLCSPIVDHRNDDFETKLIKYLKESTQFVKINQIIKIYLDILFVSPEQLRQNQANMPPSDELKKLSEQVQRMGLDSQIKTYRDLLVQFISHISQNCFPPLIFKLVDPTQKEISINKYQSLSNLLFSISMHEPLLKNVNKLIKLVILILQKGDLDSITRLIELIKKDKFSIFKQPEFYVQIQSKLNSQESFLAPLQYYLKLAIETQPKLILVIKEKWFNQSLAQLLLEKSQIMGVFEEESKEQLNISNLSPKINTTIKYEPNNAYAETINEFLQKQIKNDGKVSVLGIFLQDLITASLKEQFEELEEEENENEESAESMVLSNLSQIRSQLQTEKQKWSLEINQLEKLISCSNIRHLLDRYVWIINQNLLEDENQQMLELKIQINELISEKALCNTMMLYFLKMLFRLKKMDFQDFKEYLQRFKVQNKNSFSIIEKKGFEQLIQEKKEINQVDYPCFEYFRLTEVPSFTHFKEQTSKHSENQIITILMNQRRQLKLLGFLPEIIALTNELINIFSFNINKTYALQTSFREAVEKNIQASEREKLMNQVVKFCQNWNKIMIGKSEKYQLKRQYSEIQITSKLSCFLLDQNEKSPGVQLKHAIEELSDIQNTILDQIFSALSTPQQDRGRILVQKCQAASLLSLKIDNQALYSKYSQINPEYGKGLEIEYDLESIQVYLTQDLFNKKLLERSGMVFNSYFGEINTELSENSSISQVRLKLPQSALNQAQVVSIKARISQIPDQLMSIQLSQLLTRLQSLINNLQASSQSMVDTTIAQAYGEIDIGQRGTELLLGPFLKDIPLKNLVSLQELIEDECYNNKFYQLDQKFKQQDSTVKSQLQTIILPELKKNQSYPKIRDFQSALHRVMQRCLDQTVANDRPLKDYLKNRQFWEENSEQQVAALISKLENNILIAHIGYIDELISEKQIEVPVVKSQPSKERKGGKAKNKDMLQ